MKYCELKQIVGYLNHFKKIFALERVDDTVIKFIFDKSEPIYVDLKKGSPTFFMAEDFLKQKIYNAPFDVLLHKNFSKSHLKKTLLLENNRIIQLHVKSNSHYKSASFVLQLEFTGRNTNAIILDENGVVVEALRHIQSGTSFRTVSVGEKLLDLPPFIFKEKELIIEDVPEYLHEVYSKRKQNHLEVLKLNKISQIQKKLQKLNNQYEQLPQFDELQLEASKLNENGSLVLANLANIKSYVKNITLKDYNGEEKLITLPKEASTPQHAANLLFSKSKKLKQKANSIHIQKENLEQKITFYKSLLSLIQNAKSSGEVNILLPKQKSKNKKNQKRVGYESFFIEDYKILVGKSQKSNIELFKDAKKRDVWLHVKDIPSSHVIIRTQKQNLPSHILEFGAKLCVNFSTSKKGSYLVDYTKWQHVKIESGSNVFYTDYKTIKINKE